MCMHHHCLHLMHAAKTSQPSRKRSSGEDDSETSCAKKQKQSSGKSQSLKFPRKKSDHGAESVLVATEKMTVVIVQHASEYMIIIKHITITFTPQIGVGMQ